MKTKIKGYCRYALIMQSLILCLCLLVSFVSGRSPLLGIQYYLFQFLGIFLPGTAICLLLNTGNKDAVSLTAFSYFFGLTLLVAEYYLLALVSVSQLAPILALAAAALSLFCIYKKIDSLKEIKDSVADYLPLVFIVIIIAIDLFCVTLVNPLPSESTPMSYNKDYLFWIGNSISFLKGLPVQNYRLAGTRLFYHYFSSIVIAQSHLISRIPITDLSYCYGYLAVVPFMIYSGFYLLRSFLSNAFTVVIATILIFFAEGSTTFLASHLYFCPFGFDYAIASAMLGAGFLKETFDRDRFSLKETLISCLIIMMTTGYKGPAGIVFLIGYGIVTFSLLLHRRWKTGLSCGTLWVLSFLMVYLTFITDLSGKVTRTNKLYFLGPIGSFEKNYWAIDILNELTLGKGLPNNALTKVLALFLYVLRSSKGAMILLIIGGLYLLYGYFRRKSNVPLLMLISISIWGILLTVNTYHDGNSQMYFIMSVFPFAALAGAYALEGLFKDRKHIAVIAMLCIMLISYGDLSRFWKNRVVWQYEDSMAVINGEKEHSRNNTYFTYDDLQLSLWLKENTDPYDYIAVDVMEYGDISKEEGFGVFSERFIWNDGKYANRDETARRRQLVEKVFAGDAEALEKLRDQENVRYLVQTLSMSRDLSGLTVVYESDTYRVYKLY